MSIRRATTIIFTLLLSFVLVGFFVLHPARLFLTSPPPHRKKVHLLLPVDKHAAQASPNFCKTLISVLVHGYEPTVINWNVEGDDSTMHAMKVFGMLFFIQPGTCTNLDIGVHEFLTNLTTTDDNAESDLVFMMDSLDVWLQLSPTTLADRFEELHTTGVVLGAVRACWPNEWDSVSHDSWAIDRVLIAY
jgi:hypothetical protein